MCLIIEDIAQVVLIIMLHIVLLVTMAWNLIVPALLCTRYNDEDSSSILSITRTKLTCDCYRFILPLLCTSSPLERRLLSQGKPQTLWSIITHLFLISEL